MTFPSVNNLKQATSRLEQWDDESSKEHKNRQRHSCKSSIPQILCTSVERWLGLTARARASVGRGGLGIDQLDVPYGFQPLNAMEN